MDPRWPCSRGGTATRVQEGFKTVDEGSRDCLGEERIIDNRPPLALQVLEFCDFVGVPARITTTVALWCDVPVALHAMLDAQGADTLAGCHGVNHVLRTVIPTIVMCDRSDIGENGHGAALCAGGTAARIFLCQPECASASTSVSATASVALALLLETLLFC